MTREERDRREAEKKARMEGSPDMGGVTLPFSRSTLLRFFWAFAAVFPAWTLWNAREDISFEGIFAGSVLYFACLLPSWLWATGRIQGLPIFPIFGLTFLPTYVTPLWQGHSALAQYTPNEINTAAWTVAGFLLIAVLFWHQIVVRTKEIPPKVRMIEIEKAKLVLLSCLVIEVIFELLSVYFAQLGSGVFAAIRGFASAAGKMGLFIFSYQMGEGKMKPWLKAMFLILLSLLIIEETASLLLATVIPTVGLVLAGFTLGSGKIPWKALIILFPIITVLHAGKYEMRTAYLAETSTKKRTWAETPSYFAEWLGYGLKNLGVGQLEGNKNEEVSSAKERASLIQLLIKIQTTTPAQKPFLEGETYKFIPESLIPRIVKKDKAWAHTANIMLSLYYGILSDEAVMKTSVAFDPIMEAYANYGFIGVLVLAIVFGCFLGIISRATVNVPMLSFGFLFGVQIIAAVVAAWNTTGVLVTTVWQSLLAIYGLSLVLMSKQSNPVWKYYAFKLAKKLKFETDAKLKKALEEELRKEEAEVVAGSGSLVAGSVPTAISENPSTDSLRHERPTRFVYGEKKK